MKRKYHPILFLTLTLIVFQTPALGQSLLILGPSNGIYHYDETSGRWHLSQVEGEAQYGPFRFTDLTHDPENGLWYATVMRAMNQMGGQQPAVLISSDGGRNWVRGDNGIDLPLFGMSTAIEWVPSREPYVAWGGAREKLYSSIDSGRSWQAMAHDSLTSQVTALASNPSGTQLQIGSFCKADNPAPEKSLLRSIDGGETLSPAERIPPMNGNWSVSSIVNCPGSDGRWIAANRSSFMIPLLHGSVLWVSGDEGQTWRDVTPNITGLFGVLALQVDPSETGRVWALSRGHGVLRSDDFGETWQLGNEGLDGLREFSWIGLNDSNTHVYLYGPRGDLFRYSQEENEWVFIGHNPLESMPMLALGGNSDGLVFSDLETIWKYSFMHGLSRWDEGFNGRHSVRHAEYPPDGRKWLLEISSSSIGGYERVYSKSNSSKWYPWGGSFGLIPPMTIQMEALSGDTLLSLQGGVPASILLVGESGGRVVSLGSDEVLGFARLDDMWFFQTENRIKVSQDRGKTIRSVEGINEMVYVIAADEENGQLGVSTLSGMYLMKAEPQIMVQDLGPPPGEYCYALAVHDKKMYTVSQIDSTVWVMDIEESKWTDLNDGLPTDFQPGALAIVDRDIYLSALTPRAGKPSLFSLDEGETGRRWVEVEIPDP